MQLKLKKDKTQVIALGKIYVNNLCYWYGNDEGNPSFIVGFMICIWQEGYIFIFPISFSDVDVEYLLCGLQALVTVIVGTVMVVIIFVVISEILNVGNQSEWPNRGLAFR